MCVQGVDERERERNRERERKRERERERITSTKAQKLGYLGSKDINSKSAKLSFQSYINGPCTRF